MIMGIIKGIIGFMKEHPKFTATIVILLIVSNIYGVMEKRANINNQIDYFVTENSVQFHFVESLSNQNLVETSEVTLSNGTKVNYGRYLTSYYIEDTNKKNETDIKIAILEKEYPSKFEIEKPFSIATVTFIGLLIITGAYVLYFKTGKYTPSAY